MNEIKLIKTDQIHPNEYNPNEMTDSEFSELVSEVEHLGRLPKPVIVRPNAEGYVIVDGEHGWRAGKENGLTEIPCEVIEVDDFEAMRQTYKRNQHGTHDKVLLGLMFEEMMEGRNLSQRAFAKEMEVSEGTVRNALEYAKATRMRIDYAFQDLTVRQVRKYMELPRPLNDVWLDAGADLDMLWDAFTVPIINDRGKTEQHEVVYGHLERIIEIGIDVTWMPPEGHCWKREGFIKACHRSYQLYDLPPFSRTYS